MEVNEWEEWQWPLASLAGAGEREGGEETGDGTKKSPPKKGLRKERRRNERESGARPNLEWRWMGNLTSQGAWSSFGLRQQRPHSARCK